MENTHTTHKQEIKLCAKCVLPSTFPNITFNDKQVCNFCVRSESINKAHFNEEQKRQFISVVDSLKNKSDYDAVCCYSGGKDSTYMLKLMVEDLGLKVLAYTLDNGFITEQSVKNIVSLVDMLGVDHIFFRPSNKFMTQMYRKSIMSDVNQFRGNYKTRISDVCLSCISVVNTHAARLALQYKIPMIFSGFTKGQIPKAVIKNNYKYFQETFRTQKLNLENNFGSDSARYFDLPESEFEVYQMSPYLVYDVSEEQILKEIEKLGWKYPKNLDGCTSNCSLNAVGNHCHEKKFGFHPYASELSQLVRENLLTREEALKKLKGGVEEKQFQEVLKKLGMSDTDLESICAE